MAEIPRLYLLCVVQDFSNIRDQAEKAQIFWQTTLGIGLSGKIFIWLIKIHLFPLLSHVIDRKTHITSFSSDFPYIYG